MKRFAYVNSDSKIVENISIGEDDWVLENWVETSDVEHPAMIGGSYDGSVFINPKPFDSWTLDENKYWQPPVVKPNDGKVYSWNKGTLQWVAM